MSVNGRFGGHIVTGHVDGIGTFVKKIPQGLSEFYYFSTTEQISNYIVYKGSICINGISLTVANIDKNEFGIAVIPHTQEETTLQRLKIGEKVNLETDILAKYIEKFLHKNNKLSANPVNLSNNITEEYLKKYGF
ncbi:MAG: riboflavin synthase, partial [Candidatus Gastranaerophilales bacterium]|nr:riboflavin synthase [Candidatus Gastranaerophilales bacterium]